MRLGAGGRGGGPPDSLQIHSQDSLQEWQAGWGEDLPHRSHRLQVRPCPSSGKETGWSIPEGACSWLAWGLPESSLPQPSPGPPTADHDLWSPLKVYPAPVPGAATCFGVAVHGAEAPASWAESFPPGSPQ